MTTAVENVSTDKPNNLLGSRWFAASLILLIGVLLGLVYSPLLFWLGRASISSQQLNTGGLLVLFAIVICLRDTLETLRIDPNINSRGLALLLLAFGCLWAAPRLPVAFLPLILFSFCLAFAAIVSFLFGELGVRRFLPALGGFVVFGLLVALFPKLDWPLRAIAAKYSASLLSGMHVPVQVAALGSRPPELLLKVGEKIYVVATECNGFGLLTSSLLLATILGFQYQLVWVRKLGLFAFAIPAAIAFNFLRIVGICLAMPRTKLSYSFVHEGIGTIFYLAGLALVWYAAGEFADKAAIKAGERTEKAETKKETEAVS